MIAPLGCRPGDRDSSIDKSFTFSGQSTQKANQNASCLRLIYLLFTRKSEGQRWRRMWRLAAGARAVADFRFDDRIEGTGSTQPGMTETSPVPELANFAGNI
jgi:hypothetical protein